ncbi:MAG: outer membrane protein, partial [Solirubrobacteraceae bacterium]|nr:outer membrane protein [Solirubrobacteraceae bacterium]
MRWRGLATGILCACLVAATAAQERLSLEDAQARAEQASHRLAEARARQAAAEAGVAVAVAADRPLAAVSAGYTRTNHVTPFAVPSAIGGLPRLLYPDVPDNYRTRVDLQWPIYDGGRTDALERAARAEASASAADVAAAAADLRLEVARAFWALVTAGAAERVLEQGVARARANVGDVRERLNAGLIPPNEVASAEAQESRQRMLLIEAHNQRELSSSELARLIGGDILGPTLEPAADLDAPLAAVAAAQPVSLIGQARDARPERRALEQRIEATEEQVAAARAGGLPAIAVVSGFDYARPNPRIFPRADRWDDSWDAGVNVSWNMWDGGRTRAEVARAGSLVEATRQRLAEFDTVVALEVRQRQLEIDSGAAAIAAAADTIRAAAEARRVVAERYRAGVATQSEVLDADFALLQAELDRTQAIANAHLADARMARAL